LFVMPAIICISEVAGVGAVARYNERAAPSAQIRRNDFLVEVNGEVEADRMALALRSKDPDVKLKVYRAPVMCITLTPSGRHLGLRARALASHSVVYIESIMKGMVADYNAQADPALRIQVSDCVTAVNGATTVPRMVEALKERGLKDLEVMIIRPTLLCGSRSTTA